MFHTQSANQDTSKQKKEAVAAVVNSPYMNSSTSYSLNELLYFKKERKQKPTVLVFEYMWL